MKHIEEYIINNFHLKPLGVITTVDQDKLCGKSVYIDGQETSIVIDYRNYIEFLEAKMAELVGVPASLQSEENHDYVIIGGKKWATMNLGATTVAGSYMTCAGHFYAWGEITPRYTNINWSGSEAKFTSFHKPYNMDNMPDYTGTILDAAHDAVMNHPDWDKGWRTPTTQDFKDLYNACGELGDMCISNLPSGSTSTTAKGIYWCDDYDGVAGLLFCDGTNKLFFPASGYVGGTYHCDGGKYGMYWSSLLNTNNIKYAFHILFYCPYANSPINSGRQNGFPIRPIKDL